MTEPIVLSAEAVSSWQGIQDSLAVMAGLELSLYGESGQLGRVSGESPFCSDIKRVEGSASRCARECAGFARQTLSGAPGKPMFFRCYLGQKVFAVRLGLPGGAPLSLVGGKTFGSRGDYDKAVSALRDAGVKVQATARHKYRFVGKQRTVSLLAHVLSAAEQYFSLSINLSAYRLRLSRQSALMENAGLLYHVNEIPTMADGFMRALDGLFGAELASIHLLGIGEGEADLHFARGIEPEALIADSVRFTSWLTGGYADTGGQLSARGRSEVMAAGLSDAVGSALCVPAVISGELVGFACVYDKELNREDLEAFKSYTRQIATAIDNRRLRTGVLEKLKRLKAMSALYASSGMLQDPDEIFRLLLDKSTEIMKAERGSLMLINEKTDELFVRFSKGIHEEALREATSRPGEGIAGLVAQTGAPIVVSDGDTQPRPGLSRRPEYKTGSFISIPLKVRGRVVGVVNITDKMDGGPFDYDDMEFLLGLASHAGSALERTSPGAPSLEGPDTAGRDELTGLMSRASFDMRLGEELLRTRRYGRSLSVVVMELGDMDKYRDTHGERAVNETIRRVSLLFGSSLRACDIISRRTEAGFAAALPETSVEQASALAERLVRRVGAVRFPDAGMNDSIRIPASLGVAGFPGDADEPEALIEAALRSLNPGRGGEPA